MGSQYFFTLFPFMWFLVERISIGERVYINETIFLMVFNIVLFQTSDKISNISLQPSTNAMWGRGSNTKKDVPAVNQKSNIPSSSSKKNVTKTSNAFTLLGDLGSDTPVPDRTSNFIFLREMTMLILSFRKLISLFVSVAKDAETKKVILTDENFARSE